MLLAFECPQKLNEVEAPHDPCRKAFKNLFNGLQEAHKRPCEGLLKAFQRPLRGIEKAFETVCKGFLQGL